jgi:hypothetical protein
LISEGAGAEDFGTVAPANSAGESETQPGTAVPQDEVHLVTEGVEDVEEQPVSGSGEEFFAEDDEEIQSETENDWIELEE